MGGILAGAIANGIGQAAEATARLAKDYIDDERKVDVYRQMSDVDVMKQDRIDELKKARDYEYDLKKNDPNGQYVANELQNSNLKARQDAINAIDKVGTRGYLESITQEDLAKSAGERSVKGMAPGETASDRDAARIKNDIDREVAALRKEAAKIDTTPERKKQIKETIEILTGKDSDNYGHYTDQETGKTVIYNKKDGKPTSSVGGAPAGPWSKFGQ